MLRVGVYYIGWARCLQPSLTARVSFPGPMWQVGENSRVAVSFLCMNLGAFIPTHIQPTDKITFLREAFCTFYETVVQQGLKQYDQDCGCRREM